MTAALAKSAEPVHLARHSRTQFPDCARSAFRVTVGRESVFLANDYVACGKCGIELGKGELAVSRVNERNYLIYLAPAPDRAFPRNSVINDDRIFCATGALPELRNIAYFPAADKY